MIDGINFFDKPIKNNIKIQKTIRKTAAVEEDVYAIGCSLNYPCLKENHKLIAIYLSKKQTLDADFKAIQQINLIVNLDCAGNKTTFSFLKK